MNKALEEIVNNASAQIIDIIDKTDRHSDHVKDLQIPTSKDVGQQQAVADATAATDDGNSGGQPKQDAMEVKGTTAVVAMQSISSEDKYGDALELNKTFANIPLDVHAQITYTSSTS